MCANMADPGELPETKGGAPQVEPPSTMEIRIKTVRLVFSAIGMMVCMALFTQGVVILVSLQKSKDFWDAAHWISEAVLCFFVALGGAFLEVRELFPSVATDFAKFASFRLALALVYLWIGAFAVGGRIAEMSSEWATFGQVSGVVSWVVCAATFFTSCCAEKAAARQPKPAGVPGGSLPEGGWANTAGMGAPAPASLPAADVEAANPFGEDAPAAAVAKPAPVPTSIGATGASWLGIGPSATKETPAPAAAEPQQWNTVGSKPFGSA